MDGCRAGANESGGNFLDNEAQCANAVADQAVTRMESIIQTRPEGAAIIRMLVGILAGVCVGLVNGALLTRLHPMSLT